MEEDETLRRLSVLKEDENIETINSVRFNELLRMYSNHVSRHIEPLNDERFNMIPARCASRKDKFLTKCEVSCLLDWMYQHDAREGRHAKNQNYAFLQAVHEYDVLEATTEGLREYSNSSLTTYALRYIQALKGVGFKAATLILACAYPENVPFLSHELCEWVGINDDHYDQQTYNCLMGKVGKLIERMKQSGNYVKPADVEQVAFVLMRSRPMRESCLPTDSLQVNWWRRLGAGGGCEAVFDGEVKREHPASKAAVKVISGRNGRVRYLQLLSEITVLTKINQNGLVSFYGWTYSDGHFHIAMELMCCDLETYLRRGKRANGQQISWRMARPKTKVQQPIRQLIDGLCALHNQGIVHRDFRPKNIFTDKRGNLKIGDFGISKRLTGGHISSFQSMYEIWGYTAPEIIEETRLRDPPYSTKVDIWSLGCVLYRMLTGEQLFDSIDDVKLNVDSKLESLNTLTVRHCRIKERDAKFLRCLICKDTEKRLDVYQALGHKWLGVFMKTSEFIS